VRAWSPYTERGTVIAVISGGSSLGLALGAPAVAWLIATLSWRWSFILTGAVGFVWVVVVWLALVSTPEKTSWLTQAEREHILAGRTAGIAPPSHGSVGYLGLIRCPAMWGPFISQAAELPTNRTAPVDAQLRHFTRRSRFSSPWWSASWPIGLATDF
jgi:MFS family permease